MEQKNYDPKKDDVEWVEAWMEPLEPPYVLLLIKPALKKFFAIYDPKEAKVVFESNDLEETRNWLMEDEFTVMEGRERYSDYTGIASRT